MNSVSFSAILVDDEPDAIKCLVSLLEESFPKINILATANNASNAFNEIARLKPDIVFLDVEMPGKSGLDLALDLKENNISTTIIFTTAYDKYAIEAIKYAAFDYLLKPVVPSELIETLERFFENSNRTGLKEKAEKLNKRLTSPRLHFNTKEKILFINPVDIVYCKADGNYTHIHLYNGSSECITLQLGKLEKELMLKNLSSFIRVSRSAIINLEYLAEINHKSKTGKVCLEDRAEDLKMTSRAIRKIVGS